MCLCGSGGCSEGTSPLGYLKEVGWGVSPLTKRMKVQFLLYIPQVSVQGALALAVLTSDRVLNGTFCVCVYGR